MTTHEDTQETDYDDEDVTVSQGPDGVAILPRSLARISGDARAELMELLRVSHAIREAELAQRESVRACRLQGLAWSAIGWSAGLTGEGARKRWSEVDDEIGLSE